MTQPEHQSVQPNVLEYRARGAHAPGRRVTPADCIGASMGLGVVSWLTALLLLAGGWWPAVPLGLAAAGLALGAWAGVQALGRDASETVMFAVFLNFSVLGLWLLALALL